jgi:hypothetical protein
MAKDSIKARIGLDTSPLRVGLQKSQNMVSKFAKTMKSTLASSLAIVTAGTGALARKAISLGSELSDVALRTGTTTDEIQALRDASRDAGVGFDVLERALRNIQLRTQQAVDGNKKYSEALARLGIDANAFVKMPVGERFEFLAKQMSKAKNRSEAFADVAAILGERAGPQLLEVLNRVASEGLPNMVKALDDAGALMGNKTIMELDKAEDTIQKFQDRMTILAGNALGMFTKDNRDKMVLAIKGMLVEALYEIQKFTKQSRDAFVGMFPDKIQNAVFDTQMSDQEMENAKKFRDEKLKLYGDEINAIDDRARAEEQKKKELEEQKNALLQNLAIEGETTEQVKKTTKEKEKQRTLGDVLAQKTPSGRMGDLSKEDRREARKERNKILSEKKLARQYLDLEKKTQSLERVGLTGFTGESATNIGGGAIDQQNIGYGTKGQMRDILSKLGINTKGMGKSDLIEKISKIQEKKKSGGKDESQLLVLIEEHTKNTAEMLKELT